VEKPVIRDAVTIAVGDSFISIMSGLCVFGIIGYLVGLESPLASKISSYSLAFVAFPTALSNLPAANFFCILLFFMLMLLGLSTSISYIETILTLFMDV